MAEQEQRYCPACGAVTGERFCPTDGVATVVRARIEADAVDVRPGDVVDNRYRIVGLIGRGGFGAVYLAEHASTRQRMALKMMLAGDHDDDEVRRFYREAQFTASLTHPNTVRVFDVGQTASGALFIAMELLDGPTLEDVLKQRRILAQNEIIDIALPVLRSLGEAHAKGLVHRDLKPANVMLSRIGGDDEEEDSTVVKVLDFGIARTQDSSLTGQGTALGTPAYMAPEQCQGADLDGRADLYSLAVIMYRAATGKPPFMHRNAMTVMYKHLHEEPRPLASAARSEVTEGFVEVVMRALAKAPEDRFANARAMRKALEAVRGGRAPEIDTQPYVSRSPSGTMLTPIGPDSDRIDLASSETLTGIVAEELTHHGPAPVLADIAAPGSASDGQDDGPTLAHRRPSALISAAPAAPARAPAAPPPSSTLRTVAVAVIAALATALLVVALTRPEPPVAPTAPVQPTNAALKPEPVKAPSPPPTTAATTADAGPAQAEQGDASSIAGPDADHPPDATPAAVVDAGHAAVAAPAKPKRKRRPKRATTTAKGTKPAKAKVPEKPENKGEKYFLD